MQGVLDEFTRDLGSVYALLDFDLFIIDLPLKEIGDLKGYAEKHQLQIVQQKADKLEKLLSGIRKHGSTKLSYETIYNQCIVLSVSYFAATLENLFEYCIESAVKDGSVDTLLNKELKLRVKDMCALGSNPLSQVGEFLITSNNISFQDMQSICRAFKEFLRIEIVKDELANDIILSQAARHIIVHNGAVINSRFTNQIASAEPRTVKSQIPTSGKLRFSKDEVIHVGKRMESFVRQLIGNLLQYQR